MFFKSQKNKKVGLDLLILIYLIINIWMVDPSQPCSDTDDGVSVWIRLSTAVLLELLSICPLPVHSITLSACHPLYSAQPCLGILLLITDGCVKARAGKFSRFEGSRVDIWHSASLRSPVSAEKLLLTGCCWLGVFSWWTVLSPAVTLRGLKLQSLTTALRCRCSAENDPPADR